MSFNKYFCGRVSNLIGPVPANISELVSVHADQRRAGSACG